MHKAIAGAAGDSRKDKELFLYLRLETAGREPLLADEDVSHVAQTTLMTQARMHRCRVPAVNSDRDNLYAVIQFPASLALKSLADIVRDTSAGAVARVVSLKRAARLLPDDVWGVPYQMHTLSSGDVQAVINYVCHQVGQTSPTQLAWHDFLHEANAVYGDSPDP